MNYSIGITTYKYRFDKWFKPLLSKIKELRPDIEVLVAINGENKQEFDETFRKGILEYTASQSNTFVTVYPTFRSLSKLWNNLLINSSNHKMLLLNDDITITGVEFFDNLEELIRQGKNIFKINGSWSHSFLDRRVVNSIGWFDERYLSIGEEDGDFEWRIGELSGGHTVPSFWVPSVINHVDHENCLVGMEKVNAKYSKFNYDFAFSKKYEVDDLEGKNYGQMNRSLLCKSPTPPQHLVEPFYWDNKDRL